MTRMPDQETWIELAKLSQDSFFNRRNVEWKTAFGLWTAIGAWTYFAVTHAERLATFNFAAVRWPYFGLIPALLFLWQLPIRRGFEDDKRWKHFYMHRAAGEQPDKPEPSRFLVGLTNFRHLPWTLGQTFVTTVFLILSWFAIAAAVSDAQRQPAGEPDTQTAVTSDAAIARDSDSTQIEAETMNSEWWLVGTQALAAAATLLVVIIAIWGERIKFRFGIKPHLTLELFDLKGQRTSEGSAKLRYYHLRIGNAHQWAPARNVIVVIRRVRKELENAEWDTTFIGAMQLAWQRRIDLIPPTIGSPRICDLFYVADGRLQVSVGDLNPEKIGANLNGKGKLRVDVAAEAENGESEVKCFEISWDGKFADGDEEMSKHLSVKEAD